MAWARGAGRVVVVKVALRDIGDLSNTINNTGRNDHYEGRYCCHVGCVPWTTGGTDERLFFYLV